MYFRSLRHLAKGKLKFWCKYRPPGDMESCSETEENILRWCFLNIKHLNSAITISCTDSWLHQETVNVIKQDCSDFRDLMIGFSFEIHKIICTDPRAPRSDIPKLKTKDDEKPRKPTWKRKGRSKQENNQARKTNDPTRWHTRYSHRLKNRE